MVAAGFKGISVGQFGHLIADGVNIIIGNPHLFHHGSDLRKIQLLGALQAKPFVDRLAVFHFGEENHRNSFFTSGTKHIRSPLCDSLLFF